MGEMIDMHAAFTYIRRRLNLYSSLVWKDLTLDRLHDLDV